MKKKKTDKNRKDRLRISSIQTDYEVAQTDNYIAQKKEI